MPRKKLILLASNKMDSNKKEDRNENSLIRMPGKVRSNMGFDEENVEIYPSGNSNDRIAKSQLLEIFHAYSADIKRIKEMVSSGEITPEEATRIGFVTTNTLNKINGGKSKKAKDIWVSNTIHDTVMGSDPEFLLFEKGKNKVIHAANKLGHSGELGSDGAMAEIRPKPSATVEEHVSNIENILKHDKYVKNIKEYNWMAGCYYKDNARDYPIGGHIHIGNPVKVAKLPQKEKYAFFRVVNKILDELLAVPMTKLDGAEEGNKRRTNCRMSNYGGYGFFGEWRPCDGRLEHRTLSGMWLAHPSIAKAVLGTAKAIIDEIFRLVSHSKFNLKYMCLTCGAEGDGDLEINRKMWKPGFNGWKDVKLAKDMQCIASSDEIITQLNESKPGRINTVYLRKWLNTMKGFSTYKDNAHYVNGLYEILNISFKQLSEYDKELQNNWLKQNKFLVEV